MVFTVPKIAFDPDGEAAAEPLFDIRESITHVACPADDGPTGNPVSSFRGITACAGVEKGKDLTLSFIDKKIDIPYVITERKKYRAFRLKPVDIDYHLRSSDRGRGVERLSCA